MYTETQSVAWIILEERLLGKDGCSGILARIAHNLCAGDAAVMHMKQSMLHGRGQRTAIRQESIGSHVLR